MHSDESFDNSTCADQIHLAECELASFIGAITGLFGPKQALLSADDWLDESDLMDSSPRRTSRDWRAVTVAASARLANRLTVAPDRRAATDTKLTSSPPQAARIPTESDVGPISSVGSSHNRPCFSGGQRRGFTFGPVRP
jgi:hypothetical protein